MSGGQGPAGDVRSLKCGTFWPGSIQRLILALTHDRTPAGMHPVLWGYRVAARRVCHLLPRPAPYRETTESTDPRVSQEVTASQ